MDMHGVPKFQISMLLFLTFILNLLSLSLINFNALGQPQAHKGSYLFCDGGYHKWRISQRPQKHAPQEETQVCELQSETPVCEERCRVHLWNAGAWSINMFIQNPSAWIESIIFARSVFAQHAVLHAAWIWCQDDDYYVAVHIEAE